MFWGSRFKNFCTLGTLALMLSACAGNEQSTVAISSPSSSSSGQAGSDSQPTPEPTQATFASISENILESRCVKCHREGNASGGLRLDSYGEALQAIDLNDPKGSPLFRRMYNGSMPPPAGDNIAALDVDFVLQWIDAGAPNN